MIKSIVDSCGLSPNTIKVSRFSTCADQDEQVNKDSKGRIQGCTAMTAFDTGEGVVNLCQNDSWVTSQGGPAGWVHKRCPATCELCDPNAKEVACLAAMTTSNTMPTTAPSPTTTPSPIVVAPKAPADTKHFVTLTVTMPYTKAEFDQDKQDKYKAAVASAAGTDPANVEILGVTEVRRRAGSIQVETKVRLTT